MTSRTLMSRLLLVVIAGMFAVELQRGALGNDAALLSLGALPDSGVLDGDIWRLLTYAILHASWAHFLLNAALLTWVGPIVERRLGSPSFTALIFVSALASGISIYLKHFMGPTAGVSVGLSGVLFACVGAAIVLLTAEPRARVPRIALWCVLVGGIASSLIPGVSLVGHVSGALVGAAWARLMPRTVIVAGVR